MYDTRAVEAERAALFSVCRPFSPHLMKWEDALLPDKYDHNAFEYRGQPSREELQAAIAHQRGLGAAFLKLEGDAPLSENFGLERTVTLTMVLEGDAAAWRTNGELRFARPGPEELTELELRHYGSVYGEDFCRRNIRRLYEKLPYHGAYLDGRLAGACHSFGARGLRCVDGLLVDSSLRRRHVATSLLAHIAESFPRERLFLHADAEDSPRTLYERLGFAITDRLYEYSCQRLEELTV